MKIATGNTDQPITPKSSGIVADHNITFTDRTRADRSARQVIAAIEAHDCGHSVTEYAATLAALDVYMTAETMIIDAIRLFNQDMADEIHEAYRNQQSILRHGISSLAG